MAALASSTMSPIPELGEVDQGSQHELSLLQASIPDNMKFGVVVEALKPKDGDKPILVAFISFLGDTAIPEDEREVLFRQIVDNVQERLSAKLPTYMVPSAFIPIKETPMTASGKVDRKYLRNLGSTMTRAELTGYSTTGHKYRAPETVIQQQLQALWVTILRLQTYAVGLDDDFFRLGGDSIGAMRLVAAAREHELQFTVADIFRYPKLSELAEIATLAKPEDQVDQIIPPFSLLGSNANPASISSVLADLCGMEVGRVEDAFPCTPLQEGLIALSTKRPGDYTMRRILRLHESVRMERFQHAWQKLMAVAPILRTRIVDLPGQGLVQVVSSDEVECNFSNLDVEGYLAQDEQKIMGLGQPLTRAGIVKDRESGDLYVIWTLHHAVYDGYSLDLLDDLMHNVYYGDELPDLMGFNRFVKRLTEQVDDNSAASFWREKFKGAEAASFPSLPSSAHHPSADGLLKHRVHVPTTQDAESYSSITLPTRIRAAWALLQSMYTNSRDIVFGEVSSGRQAAVAGVDRVLAPTITTLPVRILLDSAESVGDALRRIQNEALDTTRFEQFGLQRIRRVSDEANQACQFQTLLVMQPKEEPKSQHQSRIFSETNQFTGETASDAALNAFTTYGITLICQLEENAVHLNVSFDSAVIEEAQVNRMVYQFEHLLQQLSTVDPSTKLGEVDTIGQQDLQDLWQWNATVPEISNTCIHELFTKRVQENPEAPAISSWDGDLTYRQLDDLSTRLAYKLVDLVGEGAIVPLCFEKSMWTTVAALAVMKIGGASVAMDVGQPAQRLQSIVSQVQSKLVLSSVNCEELAKQLGDVPVLPVGENLKSEVDTQVKSLPVVDPSARLYIAFTSGSTGTPKGAIVIHANFASAITYQQELSGFKSTSRVYDFASYAFDASWFNALHALTVGGCLCIPSDEERKNDLAGSMARFGITFADLTPALSRVLHGKDLPSLETVYLAGEAPRIADIAAWKDKAQVINGYGPAECTPSATFTTLKLSEDGSLKVTIGKGEGANTWVVESEHGQRLVPIGCVGELWLEGPIVGGGYLNEQAKTDLVFVRDPVWLQRGIAGHTDGRAGRLYKTGDLVRYNPDGTLSFIGRKDSQVKLRGQRIELGEVEYHTRKLLEQSLEASTQTVEVVADVFVPEGSNRQSLTAFVCIHDTSKSMTDEERESFVQAKTADLYTRLAATLPVYMVPTMFVAIDQVPMGATGKVDRRNLQKRAAASHQKRKAPQVQRIQPESEMETVLVSVLKEVLNLTDADISMDSSFLFLGGDSISAMQVLSRCRGQGITVTMTNILQARSLRDMASRCEITEGGLLTASTDVNENVGEPWILSPIQQKFFEQNAGSLNHYNQSYLLEVARPFAAPVFQKALEAIVARHPMLRARFRQNDDKSWNQFLVATGSGSFDFTEHRIEDESSILPTSFSHGKSLNIVNGPVFAADLFFLPDGRQFVFLVAHHLVIDLVSWRIFWHDLEESLLTDRPLPAPTCQFSQWCKLQSDSSQHLSSTDVLPYKVSAPQLNYWGISSDTNVFAELDESTQYLDEETTSLLLARSNETLRTEPIDILIAMLIYSFRQVFTDRTAPAVTMETHGREPASDMMVDLSETIGWFTAMYPLQVPGNVATSAVDTIKLAKDLRHQIPGKGRPYFAYSYHTEEGREKFHMHHQPELLINYSGVFQQLENKDALFQPAEFELPAGEIMDIATSIRRTALIEIEAGVKGGQLQVAFGFQRHMLHKDRLQQWSKTFMTSLKEVVHSLATTEAKWTLSDFPLMSLSYGGLDKLRHEVTTSCGIQRKDVADIYPCTPMQEGMLLSIKAGTASYSDSLLWKCRTTSSDGHVSVERLEAAWKRVVQHHPILATVFVPWGDEGGFAQVVLQNHVPQIYHKTLEAGFSTEALLQDEPGPVFGPGQPENALTLYRTSDDSVIVRLDICHTMIDAASVAVMTRDLVKAYASDRLEPAPPFKEFIQELKRIDKDTKLAYWTSHLQGAQPCEIKEETVLQVINDSEDEEAFLGVPSEVTSKIHAFCRARTVTRAVFLQVAWALTTSWFTKMSDVNFGYLASGRDTPIKNIDNMVGPLINMLISRINLSDSLDKVLSDASQQAIRHLENQHTSYAEIRHALGLGNKRLFNSAMTIRSEEAEGGEGEGHDEIQLDDLGGSDPQEFDMGLEGMLKGSETEVSLLYSKNRVSDDLAKNVRDVLSIAIKYVLDSPQVANAQATQTVYEAFTEHMIMTHGDQATKQKHLAGSEATTFPVLPSSTYKPHADTSVDHTIANFELSTQENGVLTMASAAWAILVARRDNSDDVVFGVLDQHRQREGLATSTPLRAIIRWDDDVSSFIEQVRESVSSIVSTDMVQSPAAHNKPTATSEQQCNSALIVRSAEADNLASNTEQLFTDIALRLELTLQQHTVAIRAVFDPAVLDTEQVNRLLQQFEHILQQLSQVPKDTTKLIDLRPTSKYDEIDIWTWNAAEPQTVDRCMHNLISDRARLQPEASAVCAWDGEISYQQLEDMSSALAHELIRLGLESGQVVPLCFEKSVWVPVAMMAVMKAGGTILLLDVNLPEERLRTMTSKATASLIMSSTTQKDLAGRLNISSVVVINQEEVGRLEASATALPPVDPSSRLYVIFTSGSTGTPKGVVITHQNFSSLIHHQTAAWGISETTRMFDFASYAFDTAIGSTFLTLAAGGCLCTPEVSEAKDDIIASMKQFQVTHIELTPTLAKTLNPKQLPSLECFALSGESITEAALRQWPKSIRMLNVYGPAECTAVSTIAEVDLDQPTKSNIGKGLGLNTWVVDPNDECTLAAVSDVGELWLTGPLVGAGYLDDIEKTKAAFVEDPLWLVQGGAGIAGRRGWAYKTGDLVRYNEDGTLTFLGRKDSQVKIRGQRVELGEIEAHVQEILSGQVSMIHTPLDVSDTETDDSNPRPMRKSQWSRISKLLPSTDAPPEEQKFLAVPTQSRFKQRNVAARNQQEFQPITTTTERQLQQLWATILGIDARRITAGDHFFELGGDSINAMKLVGAARKQGFSTTIADVFKQPKLAGLAKLLEESLAVSYAEPEPFTCLGVEDVESFIRDEILTQLNVEQDAIQNVLPRAAYQRFAVDSALFSSPGEMYHFYVDFPRDADIDKLKSSCNTVVEQFDILRTVFVEAHKDIWQVVLKKASFPIYTVTGTADVEDAFEDICQDSLRAQRFGKSFLRFFILQDEDTTRLVFRLSHAQYDGITLSQIFDAFRAAYAGEKYMTLPSFAAFIQHTKSQEKAALDYWQSLLKGAAVTHLSSQPTVKDASEIRTASKQLVLSGSLPALQQHGAITSATVFTAACAHMLSTMTGTNDVLFGRFVNGRAGHPAILQDAPGCCVNAVPVRVHINPDGDLKELITSIQDQYLEGTPYESVDPMPVLRNIASPDGTSIPTSKFGFGLVSHFQNVEEQTVNNQVKLAAETEAEGGVELELEPADDVDQPGLDSTIWITAIPNPEEKTLDVEIEANPMYYDMEVLTKIFEGLEKSLALM